MAHRFVFTVEVELNRLEGKFASREELADAIQQALESADPGSIDGDNGGQFEVSSWEVTEQVLVKKGKQSRMIGGRLR